MGSKRQGMPDHNESCYFPSQTPLQWNATDTILTEGCIRTQGRVLRQISHGVKEIQLVKKKTKTQKTAPL